MFPGLSRVYERWAGSGVAPRWFYAGAALAFEVLAAVALVRGDVAVAIAAAAVGALALVGGLWLNAMIGRRRDVPGGPHRE